LSKMIVRTVREQHGQRLVNIPLDIQRHLSVEAGDMVGFERVEGGFVVMTKIEPPVIHNVIGRRV
jgi:hypothetical protein